MTNRLCFVWGLTLTLIGACACEKVASIEKKELVPVTAPPTCSELLSTTGFGLRVANLITTDTKLDVCVRAAGGQFPAAPLFKSGATGCPDGIGYGQYTMPLKIDAGTYDVKLVPAGSGCDAGGPMASGVTLSATQSTSLIAYGTSSADASIAALPDTTQTGTYVMMRLFHAGIGIGAVDVGTASSSSLAPNTIGIPIFDDVDFGHVAAKNSNPFPVDDLGYMAYKNTGNDPGAIKTAARNVGTVNTFLKVSVSLKVSHHYDLFLMGNVNDTEAYKPRLWSCDEIVPDASGMFAQCGDPRDVEISIFHPNLTDRFTDYIDQRQDAALKAIASSTADVLCIPELYSPDIRSKLRAAVTAQGQNVSQIYSDTYTPLPTSDLSDQNHNAVTWIDPPCSDTSGLVPLPAALGALRDCLISLPCMDTVGANGDASTAEHFFNTDGAGAIGCVAGKTPGSNGCPDQIALIVGQGTHAADQCFMCAIAELSSGKSIEQMYSDCTSPSPGKPHYVYDGSTGLALVSTLTPVSDEPPEVTALPASSWNRAALRVPMRLGNDAVVDVWCANVRAPNSDVFIVNGGPYYGDAKGGDAEGGNTAEERLQIQRLISAVNQQAQKSGRRAIVLALTYASPEIVDPTTGAELVTKYAPENYALFQQETSWAELVAPSWKPTCTWCSDNPLNSGVNTAAMHMFGVGLSSSAVLTTTRTFDSQQAMQLRTYDGKTIFSPVSQYYGLQSTVRVTQ